MSELPIKPETLRQMAMGCAAMDDKKAMGMRILDVRETSSITDYLIIATGMSEPHLKALGTAVENRFKEAGLIESRTNQEFSSGWVVLDMFDFIVHIFDEKTRDLYNLEALWKDSEEIDLQAVLDAYESDVEQHKSA